MASMEEMEERLESAVERASGILRGADIALSMKKIAIIKTMLTQIAETVPIGLEKDDDGKQAVDNLGRIAEILKDGLAGVEHEARVESVEEVLTGVCDVFSLPGIAQEELENLTAGGTEGLAASIEEILLDQLKDEDDIQLPRPLALRLAEAISREFGVTPEFVLPRIDGSIGSLIRDRPFGPETFAAVLVPLIQEEILRNSAALGVVANAARPSDKKGK